MMSSVKKFLVAGSFFVPWLVTTLNPIAGLTVSAALCVIHFQSYRFIRLLKIKSPVNVPSHLRT